MKSSFENFAIAVLIGFAVLVGPLAALAGSPVTADSNLFLVIGPNAAEIAAQAGGQEVGPISAPLAVIAAGGALFAQNLRGSGAWAVRDAGRLAFLCS
ncbi:hypothetical protein [Sulfitobacter noctilucae]|uniref:hypothetical protein n=1 Tax=Sulfitobacter noctilucae TaxID=1342302 RepID=UPI0004681478|nr:hypothetical protein [Sulfitobacter noctilucae]